MYMVTKDSYEIHIFKLEVQIKFEYQYARMFNIKHQYALRKPPIDALQITNYT